MPLDTLSKAFKEPTPAGRAVPAESSIMAYFVLQRYQPWKMAAGATLFSTA